jgi:hypothetical protein
VREECHCTVRVVDGVQPTHWTLVPLGVERLRRYVVQMRVTVILERVELLLAERCEILDELERAKLDDLVSAK